MSLKLYKKPGAFYFAFTGEFGSGKSLTMLEQAILYACRYRKAIISNFYLDLLELRRYAKKYNLPWLSICRIEHSVSLNNLVEFNNSVLLIDEAGLELFARSFSSRRSDFFERFFKMRHYKNVLFYNAQSLSQVDLQIRERTHVVVYCQGFQVVTISPQGATTRLLWRTAFAFNYPNYCEFESDPFNRLKWFRPYWLSKFTFIQSPLLPRLSDLFKCYNSHHVPKPIKRYRQSVIYVTP